MIQGKTDPSIDVMLFVNAKDTQKGSVTLSAKSSTQGDFLFQNVQLRQGDNTIVVMAQDSTGNQNSKTFPILSDSQKPDVTISDIPTKLNDTQFALTGNTSKAVNVTFTITGTDKLGTDFNSNQTVNLPQGSFVLNPKVVPDTINHFTITFTDAAGNSVVFSQDILVDVSAPVFIQHNIDLLSPTYTQRVVLKGKVSKPGIKIVAFVNDETQLKRDANNITSAEKTTGSRPTGSFSTSFLDSLRQIGAIITGDQDYATTADSNGEFSIPVYLSQVITKTSQQLSNDQFLPETQIGVDTIRSGPQREPTGSPFQPNQEFDNRITLVAIDDVGHIASVQGIIKFAKCGIGGDWNIDVGDVNPAAVTPELLRLGIAQIAFPLKITYQGAFSTDKPLITSAPFIRTYELNREIRQKGFLDPLKAVRNIDARWDETYQNAYVILNLNRYNYTQASIKGAFKNRTIRVPLQIEIPYQVKFLNKPESLVQRQCWDVSLFVDVEVPLTAIPSALLKGSISALNTTINAIDTILKPLKTITTFVFITCLGSWAVLFIARVEERVACFGKNPKTDKDCHDAEQGRLNKEHYFKLICDRVFCPSVKSISYFMRTHRSLECRKFSARTYGGPEYADMDNVRKEANDFFKDKEFDDFILQPTRPAIYTPGEFGKSWEDLCIYDYVSQFDTSCLLINEAQRSLEVEGVRSPSNDPQKAPQSAYGGMCKLINNKPDAKGKQAVCTAGIGGGSACYYKDQEGNWFLAKEARNVQLNDQNVAQVGEVKYIPVEGGDFNLKKGVIDVHDADLKLRGGPYAYESLPYTPDGFVDVTKISAELGSQVTVGQGRTAKIWTNADSSLPGDQGHYAIAISDRGEVFIKTSPSTAGPGIVDQWVSGSLQDPSLWKYWHPKEYLGLNGEKILYGKEQGKALTPPPDVARNYDASKNIIINPASGIIRALQCMCLPAIAGYLALIRNILYQVKLCFETILLTGQGRSGLCRAVLTQYICDLVLDAVKCFVNKYGQESERAQSQSGIGKFFGAMRGAGEDISKKVRNRYGDKNLYQTMFNERQLIHQACLFAFTGEFDLDIQGLLTSGAGIPLKSSGFLYPHTRRFIAYDPKSGQTMHIYHAGVGLVAGTNLFYELDLVCSNDVSCNPSDGFESGKCDCYGKQERIRPIRNYQSLDRTETLTNRLSAGQILGGSSGDIYLPLQDDVRYDKVRLRWWWYEGVQPGTGGTLPATSTIVQAPGSQQSTGYMPGGSLQQTAGPGVAHPDQIEAAISQIGGLPPAECAFEVTSGFLCRAVLGTSGSVRFTNAPPSAAQDYYYTGDTLKLMFNLKKASPATDPNNPNTAYNQVPKWLCYKVSYNDPRLGGVSQIYLPAGLEDANHGAPSKCFSLIADGDYTEGTDPFTNSFTNFKITQDLFTKRLTSASITNPSGLSIVEMPGSLPELRCMKATEATENKAAAFGKLQIQRTIATVASDESDKGPLAVVITGQDTTGKLQYKVFNAVPVQNGAQQGPYCIGKGLGPEAVGTVDGNAVRYGSLVLPLIGTPQAGDAAIFIYKGLTGSAITSISAGNIGSLQCNDFNEKVKAANLKVVVQLLQPAKLNPDLSLDINNYNPNPDVNDGVIVSYGKKMEYEIPIKAVCKQSTTAETNVSSATTVTTPGTTAPATSVSAPTTAPVASDQATAALLEAPRGSEIQKGQSIEGYTVTDVLGPRTTPIPGASSDHAGIDIAMDVGTVVYMPFDGVVEQYSDAQCGTGLKMTFTGASNYDVVLCHLNRVLDTGSITSGEGIAQSGNSGVTTSPHLHVALDKDGSAVQPSFTLIDRVILHAKV